MIAADGIFTRTDTRTGTDQRQVARFRGNRNFKFDKLAVCFQEWWYLAREIVNLVVLDRFHQLAIHIARDNAVKYVPFAVGSRNNHREVGTGIAVSKGVVIESRPIDSKNKSLVSWHQAGLTQFAQIKRDQGIGVHPDPLFGSSRVRCKALSLRPNGTGIIPAIVDHAAVSALIASQLTEVEIDPFGDLGLLAPTLHHAINPQAVFVGGGQELIRRKGCRQGDPPLWIIEQISQWDDPRIDGRTIGFIHKSKVLAILGKPLFPLR